jgi:hypothetical protein
MEGLEKHRATLGNSDPDTLNSINNFEVLYDNQQGRYDEAEPLYSEVLEKRRATLGNSHPDTLMRSINNLAVLDDDNQQGGMTRPSHYTWRVWRSAVQPLYSHSDTLRSINTLALYDDNQQGGMMRPSHCTWRVWRSAVQPWGTATQTP